MSFEFFFFINNGKPNVGPPVLNLTIPWREVPDSLEPGTGSFGGGENSRSVQIECLFSDEPIAMKEILGFAECNGSGAGRVLSRTIAQMHGRYPWMRAVRIGNVQGRSPNVQFGQNNPPNPITIGPDAMGPATIYTNGLFGPYYSYKYSRFNVDFQTTGNMQFLDDATMQIGYGGTDVNGNACPQASTSNVGYQNSGATALRREYFRYVRRSQEHAVETIQLPLGAFKYLNIPGYPVPENAGTSLPKITPVVRAPVAYLTWEWFDVPDFYILDQLGLASNILNGDETINLEPFFGFPAGTLLLLTPKIESMSSVGSAQDALIPGPNNNQTPPAALTISPSTSKVTFRFKYFNPPTKPGYPYKGHNLVPAPKAEPNGSYFYYVLTSDPNGQDASKTLYQSYDFEKLFQPPSTQPLVPVG